MLLIATVKPRYMKFHTCNVPKTLAFGTFYLSQDSGVARVAWALFAQGFGAAAGLTSLRRLPSESHSIILIKFCYTYQIIVAEN